MAPVDEVAIVNCLGEVRTALAGLEAAAQASLRANEVRLHELELRTTRECGEARGAAEDDARRTMQKAEALEARVEKLEEKIRIKKVEALELRTLVDKMTLKLEAKSEQLLALEDRRTNGAGPKATAAALPALAATVAMERQAAADAAAAGHRQGGEGSSSTTGDEEDAKPKAKDDESHRKRRKRPDSAERSCSSEDSSRGGPRKHRQAPGEKEVRSPSRGARRSVSSSRSPESRGGGRRRGGGSREPRSRQRGREAHSCDSRGARPHGGHRRDRSVGRSDSRPRSRSRRPWHQSSGKGKGSGKRSEGSGLCIPFVMGKCHWGDKCRDRHPDNDDAKVAKENLQNKLCRFGMDCRRKDCIFKHPDGKRRDQRGGD